MFKCEKRLRIDKVMAVTPWALMLLWKKYSEITTGAVPRYHTGSNFFMIVVVFSFLFLDMLPVPTGTISKNKNEKILSYFLDMVPYAWYTTIWYLAYDTIYPKLRVDFFLAYFGLWNCVLGTKQTVPCTNKIHIFVRT